MKSLFIHLRLHSIFSLAEGMLSFEHLSKFCVETNQPAIAITDTNNLFGALEFSLKMISCGIQPIIGMQVNICQNGKDDKDIDSNSINLVLTDPPYITSRDSGMDKWVDHVATQDAAGTNLKSSQDWEMFNAKMDWEIFND